MHDPVHAAHKTTIITAHSAWTMNSLQRGPIHRAMKTPRGRLAVHGQRLTNGAARMKLEAEGYRFGRVIDALPWQHIPVFRR